MSTRNYHYYLGILLSTAACFPAWAQEGAGATQQRNTGEAAVATSGNAGIKPDPVSGEIVVTATKRPEKLDRIPASVQAVSSEALAARHVTDLTGLRDTTPGLLVSPDMGFGTIYMRGVGVALLTALTDGSVAVYVDDVYNPFGSVNSQEIGDVERIEVLKGPQGTLYGRNAVGGAINIVTREIPRNLDLTGNALVSVGNFNEVNAQAYLAVSDDKIGASISAYRHVGDGYLLNKTSGNYLNNKNKFGIRQKTRVFINDNWTFTLTGDYAQSRDYNHSVFTNYGPSVSKTVALAYGGNVSTSPEFTYANVEPRIDVTMYGITGTLKGEIGSLQFSSTSAYRNNRNITGSDADASNLSLLEFVDQRMSQRQWTQDFVLSSDSSQRFSWIAGLNGYTSKGNFSADIISNSIAVTKLQTNIDVLAAAAFGEFQYKITPELSITAGARVSVERRTTAGVDTFLPIPDGSFPDSAQYPGAPQRKTWADFSPKATLSYDAGGSLFYLTAGQAFKSGTFNVAANTPPINPEKITSVEVGGKHKMLDGLVQFNWSAFHYNHRDLQVSYFASLGADLQNASAEIYGLDVELKARPTRRIQISLNGEALHNKFTKFDNPAYSVPNPTGIGFIQGPLSTLKGFRGVLSPKLSGSAEVKYTIPLADSELTLSSVYNYSSSYYLDVGNNMSQGSYSTIGANAKLEINNGLEIFIYGKNLTNKRYIVTGLMNSLVSVVSYSDPRAYGIGAKFSF